MGPNPDEFGAALRRAVDEAIADGPSDFGALLRALRGADPVVIVKMLETDPRQIASRLLREARRSPAPRVATPLPIPHPLDYVWHFDPATIDDLLERIAAATQPSDLAVYLGTPALHATALDQLPDRRHLLLDRDQRRIQRANARSAGSAVAVDLLCDALPNVSVTCAVADPPWYPDHASASPMRLHGYWSRAGPC